MVNKLKMMSVGGGGSSESAFVLPSPFPSQEKMTSPLNLSTTSPSSSMAKDRSVLPSVWSLFRSCVQVQNAQPLPSLSLQLLSHEQRFHQLEHYLRPSPSNTPSISPVQLYSPEPVTPIPMMTPPIIPSSASLPKYYSHSSSTKTAPLYRQLLVTSDLSFDPSPSHFHSNAVAALTQSTFSHKNHELQNQQNDVCSSTSDSV
ncbi:hypothetical protein BCR33DRAFT_169671 [Rhizoclosmatium globosum]|uniref:Uncharacterized protein n=1 Tax=Rhizoclosmatium globosum TaxID=329046 RepID=A0A1Y2CEP7_9FUNG|nr:hypothetical protein BCR33DRAFT_169671 [Rhizoclosmatium globosum]|eukprot:ORY45523.1 hypothetical protein BCR33DRAFT_169671 [Rhizoclosmatium globosum]